MSKVKASDFHNPMPPDWDPIEGAPHGADQSVILPPGALRLFEEEVAEIRKNVRRPTMSSLVDEVQRFIARYVVMDDDQRLVVALWVLHTYVFEVFTQTPYLAVNSPEKQCGKSTLLGVLEHSCNRPWNTCNPSEAVIYRKIHAQKPTLLLDEVDGIFRKGSPYEHLATLLNVGIRAGTKVPRVLNPKSNELIEYNVFCPKVLAGIGTPAGHRRQPVHSDQAGEAHA